MTHEEMCAEIRRLVEKFGLYGFQSGRRISGGRSKKPGSSQGFVDWVIIGPAGVVFAEVKTETGRRSQAQIRWARRIEAAVCMACGLPAVLYELWRPCHFHDGAVEAILRRLAGV